MEIAVGQFVCFPVGLSQRPLNECNGRHSLEVTRQFHEYRRCGEPSRYKLVEIGAIPAIVRSRRHDKNIPSVRLQPVAEEEFESDDHSNCIEHWK